MEPSRSYRTVQMLYESNCNGYSRSRTNCPSPSPLGNHGAKTYAALADLKSTGEIDSIGTALRPYCDRQLLGFRNRNPLANPTPNRENTTSHVRRQCLQQQEAPRVGPRRPQTDFQPQRPTWLVTNGDSNGVEIPRERSTHTHTEYNQSGLRIPNQ